MSSLYLQPTAIESCHSIALRERRRSSIRPRSLIPRLITAPTDNHFEEFAVADEPPEGFPDLPSGQIDGQNEILTKVSPPSHVHLSGYSTNIDIPRHHDSLPTLEYISSSPTCTSPGSAPPTVPISRKVSLVDLHGDEDVVIPFIHENLKIRLASGYFMYFLCGWGDGVTGTVLPYFETDFHLTSLTSSLLFAGGTAGFAIGTLLIERVMHILGRFPLSSRQWSFVPALFTRHNSRAGIGHSPNQARYIALVVFSLLHASFFVMMGSHGGYPVLLLAYACAAFARAMITASLNIYFSTSPSQSTSYGFAFWSLGGVLSPLVCQSFIASGIPWTKFYFGSLLLSGINTCALAYSFRPTAREFQRDKQHAFAVIDESRPFDMAEGIQNSSSSSPLPTSTSLHAYNSKPPKPINTLGMAFSMPYQWAVSLFSWLYCGSETTTQGFMVSYLLAVRHANPKTVGYVTSGFWGGITIGRLIWGRYSSRLSFTQRKHIIHGCFQHATVIALTMHLLIWFINSNIENAFSSSVIGALYGPIFPACLGMANDLLPPQVHMVSMGLVSAFASFGASLFPFITGTIASVKGLQSLTYVTVAQAVGLICLWCLFPTRLPACMSSSQNTS